MSPAKYKYAAVWLVVTTVIVISLSSLFGVPYIYTAIGISTLVCVGHLITIDDDYPRGCSNLEEKQKVWRSSVSELGLKVVTLLLFVLAAIFVPSLRAFGA